MDLEWSDIVCVARKHAGQTLATMAGRATFTVRLEGENLFVTPTSTKIERRLSTGSKKMLQEFNKTKSMWLGDYQDMTRNSVYMLRLINLALRERRTG